MSKINQQIPEFKVEAFHKDEFKTLSSKRSKREMVYFYSSIQ